MNEKYAKLAQKIVYSSIWEEDGDTCKVWVTILALKDPFTGIVEQNITGIARLAKLPLEKVEEAFQKFQAPDPHSSTDEFEGRRLRRVPEGWYVLNHPRYAELGWSEDKKTYERERKAKWRQQQNDKKKAHPVAVADNQPTATARFKPPTREELNLAASKLGLPSIEVDKFVDHYTSNGWRVGKNKMASWPAALSNWNTRWREELEKYRQPIPREVECKIVGPGSVPNNGF